MLAAANLAFMVVLAVILPGPLISAPVNAGQADTLYDAGVAARLDQRFEKAADLFARAARLQPDNADIWVQLGLAQSAAGRLEEAQTAFERTVLLAPAYVDAHLGLGRLALWRGDLEEAGRRLAIARGLDPGNGETANLEQQVAAARAASARQWRLDVGASASDLSNALPAWTEGTIALSRKIGGSTSVAASVKAARRFGVSDAYFEGRVAHRFNRHVDAWLFAGATPSADFLAKAAIGIGASAKIGEDGEWLGPAVLFGEIAYFHYRDDEVARISPALQLYLLKGRAWVSLQAIATSSRSAGWSTGFVTRGDLKLNDKLRFFAGYSDAPDLSGGQIIASRSIFGGFALGLSDRLSATFSLSRTELTGAYTRNEASLALTAAF